VLEQGRIVDCGKHEVLVERCAIYRQLWNQQNRHSDVPRPSAAPRLVMAIKFDTFPYSQYGMAEGIVRVVSPDAFNGRLDRNKSESKRCDESHEGSNVCTRKSQKIEGQCDSPGRYLQLPLSIS
jgi:hypothetical protein